MTMVVWKAAGVRATPEEAEQLRKRRRQRKLAQQLQEATNRDRARAAWEAGAVRPFLITRALDLVKAYGPDVDVACGGQEPMVDQWEAGELYPTWEQLVKLSQFTGFGLRFFTREPNAADEIAVDRMSLWFHMTPIERKDALHDHKPIVIGFTDEALRAAHVGPYRYTGPR